MLQKYCCITVDQALAKLNSSRKGLSSFEARCRQDQLGLNVITQKPRRSIVLEALARSMNPLVAILLMAAIISGITGNVINAFIIITILLISVFLDYFQSHRSLKAEKCLEEKVATTANVLRDAQWVEIPCREIVPGDIVRLSAGDMVPADGVLLRAKDFYVQQAALTGESLPVEKEAASYIGEIKNPAEAINAVFSGSSVVSGVAEALVVSTGENTLFGEIAKTLTAQPPRTEFEKGILRFSFFIMKMVIFLVLFVFVVNLFLKHSPLTALLFAVALAVGMTPEFLPMIISVTLTTGAVRMSKEKVIVKNMAAIQNFGSMDVLCSDKTGTLTTGDMTLEKIVDIDGRPSEYAMLLAYLNSLYGTGIKNPVDMAVLKKALMNPLDMAILRHDHPDIQRYAKVDEMPFDFERRRSSVVVNKHGHHVLITKGAPEQMMKVCTAYDKDGVTFALSDEMRTKYMAHFQSLSREGYRVLAVAYREIEPKAAYGVVDEQGLTLAGFLAFEDPPLEDAAEMIQKMHREGIKVQILTGDNDLVAHHICKKVGLDAGQILLGEDLEHMTEPALASVAEKTLVFARLSPTQKQRIINALRSRGHVVGYLGDGINDAPSLNTADVGVSVSGAVDVAREAADIILLERRLNVLLNGVLEGRKSFGNVMKYLLMGTSSNFGNMLSMALIVPFLPFLPMLPTQILLNNLLYDTAQVTIPTDHVDKDFTQKPRRWNIDIIRRFMFYVGPISSIFDFLTFFVMLKIFHASESLFQTGWFVESLATQTLVIFIIRTAKNPWKSKPSLPLIITVLLIVFLGVLLPFSPLAELFGFTKLPLMYFIFLVIATLSYLILVEVIKRKLILKWMG